VAELQRLRREDEGSGGWLAALPAALYEETSSADAGRRQRALALVAALDAGLPHEPVAPAYALVEGSDWPPPEGVATERRSLGWLQAALALVLLVGLALSGLWWMQRARLAGMVTIPAGLYTVSAAAAGSTEPVAVGAFAIDRTEVTAGAYRACIEAGRCPQLGSTASATRPEYLLDGAFERFPVININWPAASDYCAFAGKRLPTAVEWEVAAGHAPGSERPNPYPWGAQFQLQRANSARTGLHDTQEVGSYRPSGDSALGAADMAGNVAEWTATNVGRAVGDEEDRFLVKGGSFNDEPDELLITFSTPRAASFAAPWLGFRCAVDMGS
jgi:formylglycine-generating enzyme required for sulfatase activity